MPANVEPRSSSISTTGFVDGLGRRSIRFDRELGTTLECLQVRPELRAFEEALLSQACAVSDLADTRFMRVRSIDQEHGRLMVISELAVGDRLADIVDSRFPGQNPVSTIDAAFGFMLQMLSAVGRLHQASIVHGALAPGRVILSPSGRVILTDTIFGTTLPRLNLSRRRLWQELQVAFPADARDNGADLAQSAMCALIVAVGRPIEVTDPLKALPALIDEAAGIARARGGEQLAAAVKDLFRLLLPVSGSPARVTVSEATERVAGIANDHLGEDACATALLEFVRYDSAPSNGAIAATASTAVALPESPIVPESAPLLSAVLAGPTPPMENPAPALTEPIQAEAVTIDQEQAAEFVPSRTLLGIDADGENSEQGAIPSFLDRVRKLTKATPFPWKVGAAAVAALVILMTIGIVAGPSLFSSDEKPATTAAATPAPAAAKPARPAAAPTAAKGAVSVQSQPEGAAVLLDGVDAGRTPLTIDNVAPGRHTITLSTDTLSVKRNVRVEAGKTVSLDVPVASGWIAIKTPIVLDVTENGRSLGTTEQGRIALAPGRHTLRMSNREVTYSSIQTVEISSGQEATLDVKPTGRVNLNAQPWAEVWIDGTRAGETPIANLQVPLGTREFVFKHPQYGERRITAKVSTVPSALSVDFTKSTQKP